LFLKDLLEFFKKQGFLGEHKNHGTIMQMAKPLFIAQ